MQLSVAFSTRYYYYYYYYYYAAFNAPYVGHKMTNLVDSCINNVLLQTGLTSINKALLRLINVFHTTFVYSLLCNILDLIIYWI